MIETELKFLGKDTDLERLFNQAVGNASVEEYTFTTRYYDINNALFDSGYALRQYMNEGIHHARAEIKQLRGHNRLELSRNGTNVIELYNNMARSFEYPADCPILNAGDLAPTVNTECVRIESVKTINLGGLSAEIELSLDDIRYYDAKTRYKYANEYELEVEIKSLSDGIGFVKPDEWVVMDLQDYLFENFTTRGVKPTVDGKLVRALDYLPSKLEVA